MENKIYINPMWEEFLISFKDKLSTDTLDNFLSWHFLRAMMFHIPPKLVLDSLQNSKYWDIFKKGIIEDNFGNPERYQFYPESSGNLIHHAYSLLQLYENIDGFDISKLNSIFEFGGGYGSFCRLIHRLEFKGKYILYDLPELLNLQKFYLTNINIPLTNISFIDKLSHPVDCDLFVSLWALEETPEILIEHILTNINAKYYLIAHNNNIVNLKKLFPYIDKKSNYIWKKYEIKHGIESSYLVGEKTTNERVE